MSDSSQNICDLKLWACLPYASSSLLCALVVDRLAKVGGHDTGEGVQVLGQLSFPFSGVAWT